MSTIFLASTALTSAAIIGLAPFAAAKSDFCFTSSPENTFVAIVRQGRFAGFLWVGEGFYLNDPTRPDLFNDSLPAWERVDCTPDVKAPSNYRGVGNLLRLYEKYGVYYYGIYPFAEVYTYTFEWTEVTVSESGSSQDWHRKVPTSFIYAANFPYRMSVKGAEDSTKIALDVEMLVTLRTTNPYKSLFGMENWLQFVTDLVTASVRDYIGKKTDTEIMRGYDAIRSAVKGINETLRDKAGQEVVEVAVTQIGYTNEALRNASTLYIVAKRTGEATIAEADAKATATSLQADADALRIQKIGDAEANAIEATNKAIAGSPHGPVLAIAKALGDKTVVVAGTGDIVNTLGRLLPPRT